MPQYSGKFMHKQSSPKVPKQSDLLYSWIVSLIMLIIITAMLIAGLMLSDHDKTILPEGQRILLRSILYGIAIITFPITNLIRYIQCRLNQTIPTNANDIQNSAKKRYLITVCVSMLLMGIISSFGLILLIYGDGTNTLYIFIGLSALGVILYRPKMNEYLQIVKIMTEKNTS